MANKTVLMVEGTDDEHVVKHVCGWYGLGKIDTIHPYKGKQALLDAIPVRLKESDIGVLGILLDADEDLRARWQAVSDRLKASGYSVPVMPREKGTVLPPPESAVLPKVGIWLMPDNKVPGILEDFLRFLVPPGDALLAHADASIANLPERRFSDSTRAKALLHTWLAWQKEPGKPYGQAVTARYLDPSLSAGKDFADWLKRTFFSDTQ
jgi:hypothetical protein